MANTCVKTDVNKLLMLRLTLIVIRILIAILIAIPIAMPTAIVIVFWQP